MLVYVFQTETWFIHMWIFDQTVMAKMFVRLLARLCCQEENSEQLHILISGRNKLKVINSTAKTVIRFLTFTKCQMPKQLRCSISKHNLDSGHKKILIYCRVLRIKCMLCASQNTGNTVSNLFFGGGGGHVFYSRDTDLATVWSETEDLARTARRWQ
jgi:hypothetical protein